MAFRDSIANGVSLARAVFQSPNFLTGVSGWALFLDGDAEFNNVVARGTIQVGGTQNIEIGVVGGVAEINFNSGLPGETTPGIIAQSTFVQPNSGATEGDIIIQSPVYNNGGTLIVVKPPDTQDISVIQMQTFGTTSPPGSDGVTGALVLGTLQTSTDVWRLFISNENGVIDPGPTLGNPPLTLGNAAQSRLFMSVTELLSLNGSNIPETIFLNTDQGETVVGGVRSKSLRHQSTALATAFTPGTSYSAHQQIVGVYCPSSGTMTVWARAQINGNTGLTAADFVFMAVQIDNVTQGTTPFAASDNRGAAVGGTFLNSATQAMTIFTQITATGIGNQGDSLTISVQFKNNSNAAGRFFNGSRTELGIIPSL